MERDAIQRYFFIGFLLAVSTLIFFIFLPFVKVIALAGILAVVLNPLYKNVVRRLGGREGWAAFLVVMIFIFTIIVPTLLLSAGLFNEAGNLFRKFSNQSEIDYLQRITSAIELPIQKYYPFFNLDVGSYLRLASGYIVNHLTTILGQVLDTLASIVFIFFSLFFFLRDGEKFKKILINLSPLKDRYDEMIILKLKQSIISTVKGVLLIALIQGLLAGVGLKIFGVPNPTLWGAISAIASLVPAFGTALVFIPIISYMYVIGDTASAIGLLAWWGLLVSSIDNFLAPYLYSKGTEIHQLVMLFAVLGGIAFFGPVGFIFGPVSVALLFSLIDIYQDLILNDKSKI